MEHVAFMRKSWGLTEKIASGQKTIESRWYKNRIAPWNQIVVGETVYFKDSGGPVCLRAAVSEVLQFPDLAPDRVWQLLELYGLSLGISRVDRDLYYERFKDKRYCVLMRLQGAEMIEPFAINKNGFGSGSAWLTVDSVERLRV